MANRINFQVGYTVDKAGLNEIQNALRQVQVEANKAAKSGTLTTELKEASKAAQQLQTILNNAWNGKLNQLDLSKLNNSIKAAYGSVEQLRASFTLAGNAGSTGAATAATAYNKFASSVLNTNLQLKQSNKLLDEMATTMSNTIKWGVTSSIFNSITSSVQKAYTYTKNLDSSLNDIRIVTDKSAESMETFARQANAAAKALGASTLDYTQASLIYYQQGLSDKEAQARAETTLKAANVTGQTGEEVSEQLTAVWNGYKVTAEETEAYVDKLAAVAATTASDLEELSVGMSKVASAAAAMGVDVDKLNGMLSTVISVTRQAPESAGTAFKTIFARMEDLELDGEDEFGVSLGEVSSSLESMGVYILDAEGSMRDLGEVIEEVGNKWNSGAWSEAEKQALAIDLAGKRQYNNLLALFENWDMYNEAVNTSVDAVGTLQHQQDIYMESTAAHLEQLRTEADKTYDILFDQDTVNDFMDTATGALEIFNNYLTGLNGGMNSLVHMGSVVANVFSNQIGKSINQSLSNLDAYRTNLDDIAMKQQIIDAHAVQGEVVSDGSAQLEAEVAIQQQILNVKEALTQEEYNKLTAHQQRMGEIAQEIVNIQSYQQISEDILDNANATNAEYQERIGYEQEFLNATREQEQSLIRASRLYSQFQEEDERIGLYNTLADLDLNMLQTDEARAAVSDIMYDLDNDRVIDASQLQLILEEQNNSVTEQTNLVHTLEEAAIHRQQAEDGTLERLKQEQQARQRIIDQTTEQAKRQQLLSQAVSGLMTVVSLMTTLSGIVQTLNNQDLTAGEKAEAIITTLLMTTPMLIMNFKNILKIGPGLATSLYSVAAAMQSTAAAEAITTGATTSLTGALSALWAVAWPYVAIAAVIAAAIAAVVIVVKQQIDAYNADAIAAEKAAEKTLELKEAYEETKSAAEKLKQTISDYSDAITAMKNLEKGTVEYKQAIIDANEKALELLNNYKNLAKFASRNEDGLIIISDEGLDEILEQQLQETELAQSRYAKGQLNESIAQQRSDLTDFKRAYAVAIDGWDELSEKILSDISDYMRNNQITDLIPEDLLKIDSIADANAEVYESILDNIAAYSDMGNQLNETREAQKLLADTCAEAIYRLNNPDYGTNPEIAQQEAAELSLFTTYQNHYALSQAEQEAAAQAYIDKKWEEFIGDDGLSVGESLLLSPTVGADGSYVPGYNPGQITADDAYKYAEMMGYDLWDLGKEAAPSHGSGFLWMTQNWDFYKNGELVESLQNEELTQAIADKITELENLQKAQIEAPELLASIDDLINSLNFGDNKNVFDNLLLSGYSDKFNLEQSGMSQQQAKDILGNWDEVIAAFENYDETNGFWQKQGFEDAQSYLDALKSWLTDRSNISDATAIGADTIASMQSRTTGSIQSVLAGELTAENAAQNEDYAALVRQLEQLAELFPELSEEVKIFTTEGLIGTETWNQAAFALENHLNNLKLDSLNDSMKEAFNDLEETKNAFEDENGSLNIEAWLQSDEFESALDKLLDANYAIEVEIHAQAEDAFEAFEVASQNLANQAKKIGEGYIVAASDIRELNNAFPGIIENMELVGDGSVKLNEQIVQSAMSSANAEIAASAQSTLEQLQYQADLLRGKQKTYQAMYEAALALAKGEGDTAENTAIIKEGLNKLEAENNKEASDTEMSNAALVATDSNIQAGIMAENWNSAYQSAANSAIAFANVAVAAAQAAQTREMGNITTGDFGVTYQGRNGQSSEAAALADLKSVAESASTEQDYLDLAEAFKNAAESAGKQANDIEGMIAQIGASTIDLSTGFGNIASGKGADGDKGGSSKKEKDPDYMEYLEDEADRYHDINLELEDLETNLSRLDKQQKKLYGQDLINNLNEQLDILEKQKAAYEVKLQIAKAEAQELRNVLAMQGVAFDSNGYMTNYASALQAKLDYVNSVIAQYNAMSAEEQEGFKTTVEAAKEDYETFKSQMERYDELVSSFIPEIEDAIQDAVDKEIEINIQKFTMEVELRLDMAEAERDFNEFKRKVIDGIKDDDILGIAKSKLKDYTSYFNTEGTGTGPIQKLTDQINNTMDQIKQIDDNGWADVYGDNKAQAMEDLQKYYEELMQQLEDVVDLVDEIKESYLDMVDEAVEAFDKQVDQYEYIKDLLNHDMNIVGLVYGDKAYAQMAQYYEKIEQNNNQELDFLKKRVAYAEEMMQKETDPEAKEKWEEEWRDALEKLNEKVEDSIQNIIDKYQNVINQVFDELNKKVTNGKGLDYVNDEWDLINKNADQYLDTINSMYAIQDLENKYLEALDQTDSLSAQQKLNNMMNEQLGMLKDKDKLTQYDVDRANMMYEIALKQIALEEAQQNKSKMRLRRDSQGNYSYQFVSDEDSIAQAQQDLLAAQNDLYNLDKEKYKENLNEIYEYYVEFQEKYAEIMSDMSLTDEERQERAKLLQEQYGELINGLVEQNETIKQNLHESTFMALEGLYAADAESFREMTGKDIEAFRNLTDTEKDLVINDLIPQWDSGVQHMADVFAGEGGFIPTCKDAFEELDQATKDYQDSLDELENVAGIDFDAISEGYDENIEKAQDLLYANDDLINKYMEEIDAILDVIAQLEDLIAKYEEAQAAAIAATEAAYAFVQAQKEASAAAAGDSSGSSSGGSGSSNKSGGSSSGSSSGNGGGSSGSGGDGVPKVGDVVTYTGGLYYYDSYGTKPTGSRGPGKKVTITHLNPSAPYPIHVQSSDSAYGWLKQSQISGYDTGGYTGDWGDDDGRLAILHKKELVLKDTDTENMLMAVGIVRDMASMLNNLNTNVMDRLFGLSTGLNVPMSSISAASDTLEQNVHIDASFPNVQNSHEIEDAFNNLVNIASQRANKTKR